MKIAKLFPLLFNTKYPLLNKPFFFLIILFFLSSASFAQKVNGYWYGVGTVRKEGSHNSYLSELIIKQNGNKITGEYNYFFRSAVIKTKIKGTYNPTTRELLLNAIPIISFKSKDQNGADCIMEGSFTLRVSRAETTLLGQFNPIEMYKFTCPAINLKFVKGSPEEMIPLKDTIAPEPEIVETPTPVAIAKPISIDTVKPVVRDKPMAIDTIKAIVEKLNERVFEETSIIDVDADSLKVILYDNGEVDNDTISLFYNRQLVASKKMLSDKPLNFTLPLDTSINEISMFAENLGSIAPNTALCIVYAGEQRFELIMASNFIKNSAIRFRKRAKQVPQ